MDERLKNDREKLAGLRSRVLLAVQILNILAAAGYVIIPMDVLPDLLGLLGYADDLLVAAIGISVWMKTVKSRRELENRPLEDPGFSIPAADRPG